MKKGDIQIDKRDGSGNTPFCTHANLHVAELLLDAKADANLVLLDENSPLHFVTYRGNLQLVKLLLAHGVNINGKNEVGVTSLILAAKAGNNDITKILIEQGADVNAHDNYDQSTLAYASELGFTEIVEQLIIAGAQG